MSPHVWLTGALWLSLPMAINIPLLWSPGGTKMLGLLVLLAIIGINAIVVPAMSIKRSKRLYSTKFSTYCSPRPFYVIIALSMVITYCVFLALGRLYTFSNAIANSALFIFTSVAIVLSYIQAEQQNDKRFLLNCLLLGMPLYVLANIVAFAAGVSGTGAVTEATFDDRTNQTLGLIGIASNRIAFPLTFGINGFGAIAAVSLLICTAHALYSKGLVRILSIMLWPAPLAALAMTDARGAVLYALLAGLSALLILKKPALIKFSAIPIALTPFVPSLGYRFFELANQGQLLSFLIRPGAQGSKLGFGTGRGDIWESILNHYTQVDAQHIIGYGAFGQVASGVSKQYAWVFNELGATTASCHNAFLQYLMDGGYIGAMAWIALLITFAIQTNKLLQTDVPRSMKLIVTSIFLLTLGQSQTEVFGTIYTTEILMLILALVSLSGFFIGNETAPAPDQSAAPWRRRRLFA